MSERRQKEENKGEIWRTRGREMKERSTSSRHHLSIPPATHATLKVTERVYQEVNYSNLKCDEIELSLCPTEKNEYLRQSSRLFTIYMGKPVVDSLYKW